MPYKIYSQVVGEHKKSVETTLVDLDVTPSNAAYRLNVRPLLRLASSFAFSVQLQVSMIVHHIFDDEEDITVMKLWVYHACDRMPIAEALPEEEMEMEMEMARQRQRM